LLKELTVNAHSFKVRGRWPIASGAIGSTM